MYIGCFSKPAYSKGFFRHFYPRLRRLGDFNEWSALSFFVQKFRSDHFLNCFDRPFDLIPRFSKHLSFLPWPTHPQILENTFPSDWNKDDFYLFISSDVTESGWERVSALATFDRSQNGLAARHNGFGWVWTFSAQRDLNHAALKWHWEWM